MTTSLFVQQTFLNARGGTLEKRQLAAPSPLCVGCQTPEDISHVPWECQLYSLERSYMQLGAGTYPPNTLVIKDFLGP